MKKIRKLISLSQSLFYLSALCRYRVAAAVEQTLVVRGLRCSSVVDIGANKGQFALVARRCFPQARIISFEPLPAPAGRYREVFSTDRNVILHEVAISPQPGQETIHLSRREDSSSLLPISAAQDFHFPGTEETGTMTVAAGPLDRYLTAEGILRPALLKLDVQGFEMEALKGCESLFGSFDYIYVECSFIELYAGQALADEVIAWLRERRFGLAGIYNLTSDRVGQPIQADFFFVRRSG